MKNKKINKIEPYTDEWYEERSAVACNFCPPIYPCKKCGHPVVLGYCCEFCGTGSPSEEE